MIKIYTDGASGSKTGGPGGWAAVIITSSGKETRLSGGEKSTTNNRMELSGPLNALKHFKKPHHITIYSDSQYVCKAFNDDWIGKWQKNDWKTSTGSSVKNIDLWKELIEAISFHRSVKFEWVKGHAGNKYNEICDSLAVEEKSKYR